MVTLRSRTSQEIRVCLACERVLSQAIPMQRIRMSFILLGLAIVLIPQAHSQSVSKFVTQEEKIREEMIVISRELGVTCNACHNVQNFREDSKKEFRISKEHMKITQMLKDNGFDGKKGPKATCYMCHRGQIRPDFKEPAGAKAF